MVPGLEEAQANHLYLTFHDRRKRAGLMSGARLREVLEGAQSMALAFTPVLAVSLLYAIVTGNPCCCACMATLLIFPFVALLRGARSFIPGSSVENLLPLRLLLLFTPRRHHRQAIVDVYLSGTSGAEILQALYAEILERRLLLRWPADLLILAGLFLAPLVLAMAYGNGIMFTFFPVGCWLAAELDHARHVFSARHVQRIELYAVMDLWTGRNVLLGRMGRMLYQTFESCIVPFLTMQTLVGIAVIVYICVAAAYRAWTSDQTIFLLSHACLLIVCMTLRVRTRALTGLIREESAVMAENANVLFRRFVLVEVLGEPETSDWATLSKPG